MAKPTIEEHIQAANILIEQGDMQSALVHYNEAYKLAQTPGDRIDFLNIMAQIELKANNPPAARDYFEKALGIFNSLPDTQAQLLSKTKAAILNNLGSLYREDKSQKSIQFHQEALSIFQQLEAQSPNDFQMHLANTHFSLGEVFLEKKDFFQAKKNFQKAIENYDSIETKETPYRLMIDAFLAKSYYHLGEIGQQKFDMYEAQSQYKKAVKIYEHLTKIEPRSFRPILAATLNNLGIVFKIWEKYSDAIKYHLLALEEYEKLMAQDRKIYAPYYAAANNSLAIVYTEKHEVKDDFLMGSSGFSGFGILSPSNIGINNASTEEEVDKQMAIDFYLRAIAIYKDLADEQPEVFTHYLATALHNLAVLYDEKKEPKTAEVYYQKALTLRRELADKHPAVFGADVAVTILNLTTLYQSFMEEEADLSYKDKALSMLEEAAARLEGFDDSKSVIKSMKSEMAYFQDYFSKANKESVSIKNVFRRTDELIEEVKSVLDPAIKLNYQQQILDLLEPIHIQYPDNQTLINELQYAYAEYAWFAIRSGAFAKARFIIEKGKSLVPDSKTLELQAANLLFAEGKKADAEVIYSRLRGQRNQENEPYEKIIEEHLEQLRRDRS